MANISGTVSALGDNLAVIAAPGAYAQIEIIGWTLSAPSSVTVAFKDSNSNVYQEDIQVGSSGVVEGDQLPENSGVASRQSGQITADDFGGGPFKLSPGASLTLNLSDAVVVTYSIDYLVASI